MRDHDPLTISELNGTFARGRGDTAPSDHLRDSQNIIFTQLGCKTRPGTSLVFTKPGILRKHKYERVGEADRWIILDSNGDFFDSTDLATPILQIPAATDFSLVTMFNRAYISPHDGQKGLAGQFVYVYQGSGSARKAAGAAPSGFTLGVVESASSGNNEAGLRLFAVAFETDSGFITKPGPTAFTQLTSVGSKKLDFSAIPVGPSGTSKRHLLATKAITGTYSGRQEDYELFFIPGGEIDNNTDTTKTGIEFFDADLVSSADYLLDELAEIPAFLGMCDYNGRFIGWGENAQVGTLRVSPSGDPESISEIDGFVLVNPGDNGNVLNASPFRGILYCRKENRTYLTQDNGAAPSSWDVQRIDSGLGAYVFCVGKVLDTEGSTEEFQIVATKGGLYAFAGTYPQYPLSWKYEDVWKRINKAYFYKVQIYVDSINKLIYIGVPLDSATENSHVLVCDYKNSLDTESVRWTYWVFPKKCTSIGLDFDFTTREVRFLFSSSEGNSYKIDTTVFNDFSTAIDSYATLAYLTASRIGAVCHFHGIRLSVFGSGNLQVRPYAINETIFVNATTLVMANPSNRERTSAFNLSSEKCSIRLRVSSANEWFELLCPIKIFGKELWASRVL